MENKEAKWHYVDAGNRVGPITEEEIVRLIGEGKVTLETSVWQGDGDWKPARKTGLLSHFQLTAGDPPPLTGSDVDNKFVWWVVAVPIIGVFIELILETQLTLIYLLANIVLCILDERKLKAAGHKAPGTGWAFVIPVYLWKRASFLNQKKHYFWCWIAVFVISMFIAAGGN